MLPPLSLSVVWSEAEDDIVAGRLDLDDERLALHGGPRGDERRLEIPLAELRGVQLARRVRDRLRNRTTLQLELRDGRVVSIAALASLGVVHELCDRLTAAAGAQA